MRSNVALLQEHPWKHFACGSGASIGTADPAGMAISGNRRSTKEKLEQSMRLHLLEGAVI